MSDSLKSVQDSIEFLDSLVGEVDWIPADWRKKIDLDTLSMASCYNCVLGQLWTASGKSVPDDETPYDAARMVLTSAGYRRAFSSAFSSFTDTWKAELKKSPIRIGAKFYEKGNPVSTRTIMHIDEVDGVQYYTYSWSTGIIAGVYTRRETDFNLSDWTTEEPKRFKNGDMLRDSTGRHYYYFSDERVIRVGDGQLSWADISFYERQNGLLVKVAYSSADFYFGGTGFKIDK